jgi:hypothetical protein
LFCRAKTKTAAPPALMTRWAKGAPTKVALGNAKLLDSYLGDLCRIAKSPRTDIDYFPGDRFYERVRGVAVNKVQQTQSLFKGSGPNLNFVCT